MSETPEPLEDLRTAMSVGTAAQTAIQHADSKAALLLTGLTGAGALTADQPGIVAVAVRTGALATIATIGLGAAIVVGVAAAVWHLGRCLAPRLTAPESAVGNRFALPDLGAHRRPLTPAPMEQQRDEAWAAAEVLAGIAMEKYRAIRASLPWAALAVVGSIGWLCVAIVTDTR
ncbi:hypothetical protein ABT369_03315 [Dactylosporangium sp. NPDC000244]|uniref:hypothetical protein n=1 Tax=Dactylosporangium sp. NPDC000244 TaxID=3154365 RepID=UPI0033251641